MTRRYLATALSRRATWSSKIGSTAIAGRGRPTGRRSSGDGPGRGAPRPPATRRSSSTASRSGSPRSPATPRDIDAVLDGPVAAGLEAIDRHPAPVGRRQRRDRPRDGADGPGRARVPRPPGLVHQRLAAAADEVHLHGRGTAAHAEATLVTRTIWLVRHAATEWTGVRWTGARSDPPLSDEGARRGRSCRGARRPAGARDAGPVQPVAPGRRDGDADRGPPRRRGRAGRGPPRGRRRRARRPDVRRVRPPPSRSSRGRCSPRTATSTGRAASAPRTCASGRRRVATRRRPRRRRLGGRRDPRRGRRRVDREPRRDGPGRAPVVAAGRRRGRARATRRRLGRRRAHRSRRRHGVTRLDDSSRRSGRSTATRWPPPGPARRLTKPPGSLGRLEDSSMRLAGITGRRPRRSTAARSSSRPADHGVHAPAASRPIRAR